MSSSATLSFVDGRIRFYPEQRLPTPQYHEITKEQGFQWHRREEAFVALYTPSREDYLLNTFGVELEEESSETREMERELLEGAKLERFEQYSTNAAKRAEDARETSDKMASFIPLGQPILVGHHSEKRDRSYRAKIWAKMDKSVEESKKAKYWGQRAEATQRRQKQRENPGTIYRRIEGLEADLRKCQREIEKAGPWAEHYQRFAEFYEGRLAYERALYAATGGIKAESDNLLEKLEVGGAVGGKWGKGIILKINKGQGGKITTVSVPSGFSWNNKVAVTAIQQVWTKAEVEALKAAHDEKAKETPTVE